MGYFLFMIQNIGQYKVYFKKFQLLSQFFDQIDARHAYRHTID